MRPIPLGMLLVLGGCADPPEPPSNADASRFPVAMDARLLDDIGPMDPVVAQDSRIASPDALTDGGTRNDGGPVVDATPPQAEGGVPPQLDEGVPEEDLDGAEEPPPDDMAVDATIELDLALDPDAGPEPDAADPVEIPGNDECPSASPIGARGRQVRRGDTTGANASQRVAPEVWYRFTLDSAYDVDVRVQGDDDWDTYLYLFEGACGDLNQIAQNDDEARGMVNSRIVRSLPPGQYRLAVSGFDAEDFGPFTLTVLFEAAVPFQEARFGATHNSYSGDARQSIEAQLDFGIRVLEFDIHDDDYRDRGDYRIGHGGPGDEVSHLAPNPPGNELTAWLRQIADWSIDNPEHAPITLVLDIKDDFNDNRSREDGNLAALNNQLTAVFGNRLLRADSVPGRGEDWPTVTTLRGRILVVLSGDETSRQAYRRDRGHRPAIALSTAGHVVEVHDDGDDTLWYWVGRYDSIRDTVTWNGHGRYDSGYDPAVAVNADGVVIEVHKSQNRAALYYRVGQVQADRSSIDWGDSHQYDSGQNPNIRFVEGLQIREVHQSQNNRQLWYREGVIDPERGTIQWGDNARTDEARRDESRAEVTIQGRERTLSVTRRDADDALRYETGRIDDAPIRYPQLAFVECQPGNDWVDDEVHFFAAERGGDGERFIRDWSVVGGIGRIWGYSAPSEIFVPNFPATDTPFAHWYETHLDDVGALRD